jgi:hypothetical protein
MKSQPTKAQLAADLALWKGRATAVKAEYDVLRSNKLRRTPKRETTGEGGIYTPSKRAHGTNIGRELERNYSSARGIIHQFRMNVVGPLGKLQVNSKDGAGAGAASNSLRLGLWALRNFSSPARRSRPRRESLPKLDICSDITAKSWRGCMASVAHRAAMNSAAVI